MGSKGFCHLINVGVGTGNSEVIYIGVGEKVVGLSECGGKEVDKSRGYTSALRDPYSAMNGGERVKLYRQLAVRPFAKAVNCFAKAVAISPLRVIDLEEFRHIFH